MNDTAPPTASSPPPPPPPPPSASSADQGPRVSSAEARDLARMQRPATERKLFGVCAGIARHFDIDPTLVRIVFVVLIFFGGAGALLYAALALILPDDRTGRAVIDVSPGARAAVVIGAAVVAGLVVLSGGWGGMFFGGGWSGPVIPVLVIGLIAVVWLITRDQKAAANRPGALPATTGPAVTAPPQAPPSYAGAEYSGYAEHAATTAPPTPSATAAPAPPTRLLPPYLSPAEKAAQKAARTGRAPRPPKTGPVLFWPTLAVIAVALGGLGWYDASGHAVADGAYAALALGITGVALLIGAFRGRAGGLVLVGAIAAVATLATTALGGNPFEGEGRSYYAERAADVQSTYTLGNGEMVVDLSGVTDLAALDGRQIDITGRNGRIEVILPADLGAKVDAHVRVVGGIQLGDDGYGGGFGPQLDGTVSGPAGSPTVDLDIDLRLGSIEVTQR